MKRDTEELLAQAYDVLGLPRHARLDDVRQAYRSLAGGELQGPHGWERLKEIDRAYETVTEYLRASEMTEGEAAEETHSAALPEGSLRELLAGYLFPPEERADRFSFVGRAFLFAMLLFSGILFIMAPIEGDALGRSFMHLVNLPFHEAGHLLFSFFGDFVRVLGGTLMQLLVPAVCGIAFLARRDAFGASAALWWVGQSFIDAAPYIYDARAGQLMLLGGLTGQEAPEFHDWHNMLSRVGLLQYDHRIAFGAKGIGVGLILLSFVWASCLLFRQYKRSFFP